jgi:glycosyltransferase involved in cell wall biosynthesis
LEISEKTKFWGFVSDKKKFELLARAHILVNPSRHEGWGLVNIEANSVGTPVVGYNVGGLKDSVKDGVTGKLVERGNYRGLAENALKLVRDKEIYDKYQKNCIKWAAKFTWEKARKQSLELIESL